MKTEYANINPLWILIIKNGRVIKEDFFFFFGMHVPIMYLTKINGTHFWVVKKTLHL